MVGAPAVGAPIAAAAPGCAAVVGAPIAAVNPPVGIAAVCWAVAGSVREEGRRTVTDSSSVLCWLLKEEAFFCYTSASGEILLRCALCFPCNLGRICGRICGFDSRSLHGCRMLTGKCDQKMHTTQ
jgi:hypothetical protein